MCDKRGQSLGVHRIDCPPAAMASGPLTSSLTCLAGKSVFLDISSGDPNRPQLKFVRKHLLRQGAVIEDFFSRSVSYVITDRNCCTDSGTSQGEPTEPLTQVTNYKGTNGFLKKAIELGTPVYRLATLESWLRRNLRLAGCVSSSAGGGASGDLTTSSRPSLTSNFDTSKIRPVNTMQFQSTVLSKGSSRSTLSNKASVTQKPPIRLSGPFVRFDDAATEHRPFYHEMSSWPTLRLDPLSKGALSTSAAGGSPFVDTAPQPTIQPGPRLVAIEKKNVVKPSSLRGYCEACGMVVADIDRHLQGDEHARRIKKAVATGQNPTASQKKSKQQSRTARSGDVDFVRPLHTLDLVISQHFGPTPAIRMAVLEAYLEQAAGDFAVQQDSLMDLSRRSFEASSQDEGDEGDLEEDYEGVCPAKRLRNVLPQMNMEVENRENIKPPVDDVETGKPPVDSASANLETMKPPVDSVRKPPVDSASIDLEINMKPTVDSTIIDFEAMKLPVDSPLIGLETMQPPVDEETAKPPVDSVVEKTVICKTGMTSGVSLDRANKSDVFDANLLVEKLERVLSSKVDDTGPTPSDTWDLVETSPHPLLVSSQFVTVTKSLVAIERQQEQSLEQRISGSDKSASSSSNSSTSSRKTRRLLPTVSTTAQALAQMQTEALPSSSASSDASPRSSTKKGPKKPRTKGPKNAIQPQSPVIQSRSAKRVQQKMRKLSEEAAGSNLVNQPTVVVTPKHSGKVEVPQAFMSFVQQQQQNKSSSTSGFKFPTQQQPAPFAFVLPNFSSSTLTSQQVPPQLRDRKESK